MRIAIALLAVLTFVSCATTPPTDDQIRQTVAPLIGEPVAPGSPQPSIIAEPTALRWTILRAEEEATQTGSTGQSQQVMVPSADALLGISFGHGLFLDSYGNLSLLPLEIWPDHWALDARYEALVTPTLWAPNTTKTVRFEKSNHSLKVYQKGLFGTSMQEYESGNSSVTALGRKAVKNKDGSFWETNAVQLLETVHSFAMGDSEIKHTTHHIFETNTTYTFSADGVESSDKSLSIAVDGDHWKIKLGTGQWWLFTGTDKAVVVDTRTGEYALLEPTTDGALLTSSRGNKEPVVLKTK